MNLRPALLLLAATVLKAQDCPTLVSMGPTCYFSTAVVNLYFGTLTLLTPSGPVSVVSNIVTASTNLAPFQSTTSTLPNPPNLISDFPGLVGQLQSDPQSAFGQIPSYVYPALTALADSNGFGDFEPMTALSDPAVADFNSDLANVGGPYTTISDTGFQQLPYDPAFCVYQDSLFPGQDCQPPAPGQTDYTFTYELGPDLIGGNTLTELVNFQIFERQVTEQLVAAPEPGTLALVAGALLAAAAFKRAAASQRSRRHPST